MCIFWTLSPPWVKWFWIRQVACTVPNLCVTLTKLPVNADCPHETVVKQVFVPHDRNCSKIEPERFDETAGQNFLLHQYQKKLRLWRPQYPWRYDDASTAVVNAPTCKLLTPQLQQAATRRARRLSPTLKFSPAIFGASTSMAVHPYSIHDRPESDPWLDQEHPIALQRRTLTRRRSNCKATPHAYLTLEFLFNWR